MQINSTICWQYRYQQFLLLFDSNYFVFYMNSSVVNLTAVFVVNYTVILFLNKIMDTYSIFRTRVNGLTYEGIITTIPDTRKFRLLKKYLTSVINRRFSFWTSQEISNQSNMQFPFLKKFVFLLFSQICVDTTEKKLEKYYKCVFRFFKNLLLSGYPKD